MYSLTSKLWWGAYFFWERFIEKKVCTAFSRTSYKIIPLTNLNKYLHNVIGETEVDINIDVNNGSEKILKKNKKKIKKKTPRLNDERIFSVTRIEKCQMFSSNACATGRPNLSYRRQHNLWYNLSLWTLNPNTFAKWKFVPLRSWAVSWPHLISLLVRPVQSCICWGRTDSPLSRIRTSIHKLWEFEK